MQYYHFKIRRMNSEDKTFQGLGDNLEGCFHLPWLDDVYLNDTPPAQVYRQDFEMDPITFNITSIETFHPENKFPSTESKVQNNLPSFEGSTDSSLDDHSDNISSPDSVVNLELKVPKVKGQGRKVKRQRANFLIDPLKNKKVYQSFYLSKKKCFQDFLTLKNLSSEYYSVNELVEPLKSKKVRLNFIKFERVCKLKAYIGDQKYEELVNDFLEKSTQVVNRARKLKSSGWNHDIPDYRYCLMKYFNGMG